METLIIKVKSLCACIRCVRVLEKITMCILCKKTFITSIISQMLFYLLNLSRNDSDTKPLDSYSSDCFEPVKWSDSVKWQNNCFGVQRRNDNNDVTPTEGPE